MFTSARWGSLASFGARTYPGTKKMYGTSGNSFVAVVEFGDHSRAHAVAAFEDGHEALAARAIHLLRARTGSRAERPLRSPSRRREPDRRAGRRVAALLAE